MDQLAYQLSRRSFLKWTALVGVGAVAGWRFALPAKGPSFANLKTLSQNQARILSAVYSAVTDDQDEPSIRNAVEFMDRFLAPLSKRDVLEFRAGLVLLEQSPLVFSGYVSRFTSLTRAEQKRCLDGWRTGAQWRRPLFGALKEFSYLALYSRSETWGEIGYTGPLVPDGGRWQVHEARYQGIVSQ